jgi:hypothetical protein
MKRNDKANIYNTLREKHPFLVYENFTFQKDQEQLIIRFSFTMAGDIHFAPTLTIPLAPFGNLPDEINGLESLVFNIGMIELLSYWKAACPPRVIVKAGVLNEQQIAWWKKLWFNGLGEFFYTNGIEAHPNKFVEIVCESDQHFDSFHFAINDDILIPVGGGKDSAVTLDLLKNEGLAVRPFMINPLPSAFGIIEAAGIANDAAIISFNRTIDSRLLMLNNEGYLNGHTPFSALLAFVTLLAARLGNIRHIALSNESSANEPTIPGTKINHQYSKSFEFEKDFREYVHEHISEDFNYFSFLRPLNELQIARLFARRPKFYGHFNSCNVGGRTDTWCTQCPKCLFTWIILSPFINQQKLISIFGHHLLDDESLKPVFDELTGLAAEKPFECVGTVDEVNAALQRVIKSMAGMHLPTLLRYYKQVMTPVDRQIEHLLDDFNNEHFLNPTFEKLLRKNYR